LGDRVLDAWANTGAGRCVYVARRVGAGAAGGTEVGGYPGGYRVGGYLVVAG